MKLVSNLKHAVTQEAQTAYSIWIEKENQFYLLSSTSWLF